MGDAPILWLIAGPDAVGKTTYAAACDLWRVLDTQLSEPRLVASGPPAATADTALFAMLPDVLKRALAGLG